MSTSLYTQTPRRYISGAEANKLIRAKLKSAFPETKFRVRKSPGSATYVDWTDGPLTREVQIVCAEFTGETFDGMTDCRDSVSQLYIDEAGDVEHVSYGTGLMIYSRDWSPETRERLMAWASRIQGLSEREIGDWAWREFCNPHYTEVDSTASAAQREP